MADAPRNRKIDYAQKWNTNQANRHFRSILPLGANHHIVIEGL
jgi:hypothetical protein